MMLAIASSSSSPTRIFSFDNGPRLYPDGSKPISWVRSPKIPATLGQEKVIGVEILRRSDMRWGRNWGSERRSVVDARRSKTTLGILIFYVLRLWMVCNLRSIPMRASSVGELQNTMLWVGRRSCEEGQQVHHIDLALSSSRKRPKRRRCDIVKQPRRVAPVSAQVKENQHFEVRKPNSFFRDWSVY